MYALSVQHRLKSDYAASERVIKQALISATPEDAAWLHRSQAENFLQTDRFHEAIAELEGVEILPELREWYILTVARCYRYIGDFEKAIELLEGGIRADWLRFECLLEVRPHEALALLERIDVKTPLARRRYAIGRMEAMRALGQAEYTDAPLVHGSVVHEMLNVRQLLCKAVVRGTWQEVLDYVRGIGWKEDGYTQTLCRGMMGEAVQLGPKYDMPLTARLVEGLKRK